MAIGDRTYQFAAHTAWGYPRSLLQNVIEYIGGYTYNKKIISAASAGSVLASTAGTSAQQVVTTGITNPDVPRVLAVTIGGTGEGAGNILITGVNVEGKTITDTIAYTTTGQVAGSLVFKRVTSVTIPAAMASTATLTVDTTNKIGLNHRCVPGKTAAVDVYQTSAQLWPVVPTADRPVLDGNISASNYDNQLVEKNWITTLTAPNGTYFFYFFYWFTKVLVYPPKDSPEFYSTTTSTSSSTTSTSTSISSTSSSISSTSSSTSVSTTTSQSTSTSISSTSTSTTTLPV